jgi:L-histidine N-alpha-methyltransferase
LSALRVQGLWGRYQAGLAWLRNNHEPVVMAFLGSSLGNTTSQERDALLGGIANTLQPGDGFLVSVD